MWHTYRFTLFSFRSLVLLICSSVFVIATKNKTCPPTNFDSMSNLDLDGFIDNKWYSIKQLVQFYQPITQFYCVYADYTKITTKSWWCTLFRCNDPPSITIFNSARRRSIDGSINSITFEGSLVGDSTSKVSVSPRFIPRPLRFLSNYWVVAAGKWNELPNVTNPPLSNYTYDWSIITTGLPRSVGDDGKCYTTFGMWIFSKLNVPPTDAITDIETIANGLGLSTSEWKLVTQEGCEY